MSRWQAELEKKQAVLGRIVDIGAELFAISAAVVYAQTIRERAARSARDEAAELADLFCQQAARRVDAPVRRAVEQRRRRQLRARPAACSTGRYTWLEEGIADPSGDGPMIAEQPPEVSKAR